MEHKICTVCKEDKLLTEYGVKTRNKSGIAATCKKCDLIRHKAYRLLNKEKCKIRNKAYRLKHPYDQKKYRIANIDRAKASAKKYRDNHPDRRKTDKHRSVANKYQKRNRDALTNSYILALFNKHTTVTVSQISPEMIEAKRLIIQLKREIKNEKSKSTENK